MLRVFNTGFVCSSLRNVPLIELSEETLLTLSPEP